MTRAGSARSRRRRAPRLLAGTISAHTAVASVSLELRRSFRGHCSFYDAVRARFVGARCGKGRQFQVANAAAFSYLLPKRLGPGRYVLDSVKGADLGMQDGRLVLDFNFAYNPSCSYDLRWACPLSPPPNRLPVPIRAGERT